MIIWCKNENDYKQLKKWAENVVKFMNEFEWLINSFLVEYYIHKSWTKLPFNWQTYLNQLEPIHLAEFLSNQNISTNQVIPPLGLLCFQKLGHLFSFRRKESDLIELDQLTKKVNLQCSKNKKTDHRKSYKLTDLNQIDSKYIFSRHLKVKKVHEVGRFSSLINNLLDSKNVELIDFGSGKGHLDRFLSIYFGFQVTTLELEQSNSKRAGEYDQQAISNLMKSNKFSDFKNKNKKLNLDNLPNHLNTKVTKNNIFNLNNLRNLEDNLKKIALIALHACGDLSTDLLELFTAKNGSADYLFLCSCCYHKCDLKNKFILSKIVNDLNFKWTFETKEISCHAIENFIEQLKTNHSKLKINCYRAILEEIFDQFYPEFRKANLAKVRNFEKLNFREYVLSATRNLPIKLDEQHLNNELIKSRLDNYLEIIKFYSLRLHLAPMIENLIQVDRILYLYENGIKQSVLIPTFDPFLSPRNFVLFASKIKDQ